MQSKDSVSVPPSPTTGEGSLSVLTMWACCLAHTHPSATLAARCRMLRVRAVYDQGCPSVCRKQHSNHIHGSRHIMPGAL